MKRLPTLESFIVEDLSNRELDLIEEYADELFALVGIDVEFTRHFKERVNDIRNKKPISMEELRDLFRKTYKKYGDKLPNFKKDSEAVIKDMASNINMPFVITFDGGEMDLVAKTIMRKKDFKSSNPTMSV